MYRVAFAACLALILALSGRAPVHAARHGTLQCLNFVTIGDSLALGFPGTLIPPNVVSNAIGTVSSNQSVGGAGWIKLGNAGVPNLTTRAAAEVDPLLTTLSCGSSKPTLFLWAGTNDICGGGSNAAQTLTAFNNYLTARASAGWTISPSQTFVATILPRGTCTGPGTEAQTFNTSLISGAPATYTMVRFDLDANIGCNGCQNNTTWYDADALHLSAAGYQAASNLICLAMPVWPVARCPVY